MRRVKRNTIVALATFAVAATAYILWPKPMKLVWYTSAPFKSAGKRVSFRALVPAGWISPHKVVADEFEEGDIIVLKPAVKLTWLPGWLRNRVVPPKTPDYSGSPGDSLTLTAGRSMPQGTDGKIEFLDGWDTIASPDEAYAKGHCPTAVRYPPGEKAAIAYSNRDPAEFEATYRPICESFRVVR